MSPARLMHARMRAKAARVVHFGKIGSGKRKTRGVIEARIGFCSRARGCENCSGKRKLVGFFVCLLID